jgi:hypothetical protein
MRHARSSPLDDHHHVGHPSAPVVSTGDPADCLTYFWQLAEAESLDHFDGLWTDFARRSRELVALAKAEDIEITLYHLTIVVEESSFFSQSPMRGRRAAILEAIWNAAVVS